MHLTDAQLNEYLDNEPANRAQAESHLSTCDNCAERLTALQALFNEIESLPEVALTRDLAAPIMSRVRLHGVLPRSLRLTVTLQAALTAIAIIFAAPIVVRFAAPYFSRIQVPSFADIFLQVQTVWATRLESLSQFHLPALPEIPVIELSGWYILLTVVVVSVLWLVGNRLLLRNQNK
jgi:anti-sigma factor RsiW